jgi:RND superfamily putative drug exporter
VRPSTIARWSASHPWRAVIAWLAFVAVCVTLGAVTGTEELGNGAVGESQRGYDMLDRNGAWPPPQELVYLHSDSLRVGAPAFRRAIAETRRRVAALSSNDVAVSLSPDRHAALVVMTYREWVPPERIRAAAASVRAPPGVTIAETGDISADEAQSKIVDDDLHRAELLSVPVTLAVLLFAFGSVVAALVPVLLALTAVAAAFGLLGPLSQAFPVQDAAKILLVLIGMAVGVDYALFYLVRSREERRRGVPSHEALATTARTSGRTVIVSGTTVAIAMAGIFVASTEVLNGIAAATIAVVACAVLASVTVLPAVLELLGARIDRGRIPFLPHLDVTHPSRFWHAVVDRVLRRPALSFALSAGVLVALALPALGLHVAKPSDNALVGPKAAALRTFADVQHEFAGESDRALIAIEGPPSAAQQVLRQVRRLERLAVARGVTRPPFLVTGNAEGTGGSVALPLVGDGANAASRHAVHVLRSELVPQTLGTVPGVTTAVTGDTAEDLDFTRQMKHGVPYVIAFVLVLAFVLLLATFRSLVVPLKAIVLNLLSVGASYGVLVLVFQHHWAEPVLGFTSNGTIMSWLPLFLFVILFGLSMDYHVFILSRVREAVDGGATTEEALRRAIPATAGVVTSAALVMVAVFALFGTLSSLDLKQAGVGLAAAVLLDATIIRAVLLPSSMALLGEANWYLPRFLQRRGRAAEAALPDTSA